MEEVLPHLPQVWQTTFRKQLSLLERKLTVSSPAVTQLELATRCAYPASTDATSRFTDCSLLAGQRCLV